jgi:anti-sigma-K factor RskA
MSGRTDHSEWYELVAAHALHALDASDEDRLAKHLEGCDDCRHELDAHALTASHLASLADDADTAPPAWSSIRAAVVGSPRSPSVEADVPVGVDELALRRERRRPPQWVLAAAAVVMVLAGATVASWQVLGANGSGNHQPAALLDCGHKPGCLEIDLRSSDGVNRAAVIVDHGSAEVQPVSLDAPASGRTFVLWQLPHGGAPIPLGEFDSTTSTSGTHPLAVAMSQTTAFAVSSEVSDTPPTTPTDVLALGGATA